MELTSAATGASALLKAVESIKKIRETADKLPPEDARYYGAWIDVASQAIKGLEEEYIEILVQAAHCQLNDPQQKRHLLERIDNYIHGEVLRPDLRDAITHLHQGREALQQHVDQWLLWLIWPGVQKNRAGALIQYDRLLGTLQGYLGSLGDYAGPSAVALEELHNEQGSGIQDLLKGGSPEAFTEKVGDLLTNLEKDRLMNTTKQCALVIETLRIAFR
jgi:hypothetical protein